MLHLVRTTAESRFVNSAPVLGEGGRWPVRSAPGCITDGARPGPQKKRLIPKELFPIYAAKQ